jgi:hypothetical protein
MALFNRLICLSDDDGQADTGPHTITYKDDTK